MKFLRLVLAVLALSAVPRAAFAQQALDDAPLPQPEEEGRALSGQELRDLVTGNTVSGRHDSGMPYSEYHSPDGRIYGHNNFDPVKDGCWQVRGDSVCYSYESGLAPGLFCWRFYVNASGSYRILLPKSGTRGSATVARGNPEHHTDNGKSWSCQALLSLR